MWRKVHILTPLQSLVVAFLSAASIAIPFAVQAIPRDEAAFLRDFLWPDKLNPYITFSLIFIGIVPALLGYYHLGRLGFMVNAGAGFALAWVMALCWLFCVLRVGHYFASLQVGIVAYVACLALVYILIASLHLRAARSVSIRDAQRKLRLLRSGTF